MCHAHAQIKAHLLIVKRYLAANLRRQAFSTHQSHAIRTDIPAASHSCRAKNGQADREVDLVPGVAIAELLHFPTFLRCACLPFLATNRDFLITIGISGKFLCESPSCQTIRANHSFLSVRGEETIQGPQMLRVLQFSPCKLLSIDPASVRFEVSFLTL